MLLKSINQWNTASHMNTIRQQFILIQIFLIALKKLFIKIRHQEKPHTQVEKLLYIDASSIKKTKITDLWQKYLCLGTRNAL